MRDFWIRLFHKVCAFIPAGGLSNELMIKAVKKKRKISYLETASSPASNHVKALLITAKDSKASYRNPNKEINKSINERAK